MGLRLRPPTATSDPTGHELVELVSRSDWSKEADVGNRSDRGRFGGSERYEKLDSAG